MSRSVKKIIGSKDRNPGVKQSHNRKFRRRKKTDLIADGKNYKKHACSNDICDYTSFDYHELEERRHREIETQEIVSTIPTKDKAKTHRKISRRSLWKKISK